jgi:hypothetical protein
MSCPENWDRLEKALKEYIKLIAVIQTTIHECDVHGIRSRCDELHTLQEDELPITEKEFSDAVTDLSRCLERAVRK